MSGFERQLRRRQRDSVRPSQLVAYAADRLSAREALLSATRAAGCTCSPTIELDNWPNAHVYHDDWCALLRAEDVN